MKAAASRGEEHRIPLLLAGTELQHPTHTAPSPPHGRRAPPCPSAQRSAGGGEEGSWKRQTPGCRGTARCKGTGSGGKQERITAHVKYSGAKQVFFPYFCFCCVVFLLLSREDPDYPVRKVCVVFLLLQPIWSVCAGLSSGRCKALAFPKQERGVGISAALPISYRASEA